MSRILNSDGAARIEPALIAQARIPIPPRPSGVVSSTVQSGSRSGAPRGSWPGSAVPAHFGGPEMADGAVAAREHAVAGRIGIFRRSRRSRACSRRMDRNRSCAASSRAPSSPRSIARSASARQTRRRTLLDIGQLRFPRAHERGAHWAWLFALRAEHVAVDCERLLIAEQVGKVSLAAPRLRIHSLFGHLAARRQARGACSATRSI